LNSNFNILPSIHQQSLQHQPQLQQNDPNMTSRLPQSPLISSKIDPSVILDDSYSRNNAAAGYISPKGTKISK